MTVPSVHHARMAYVSDTMTFQTSRYVALNEFKKTRDEESKLHNEVTSYLNRSLRCCCAREVYQWRCRGMNIHGCLWGQSIKCRIMAVKNPDSPKLILIYMCVCIYIYIYIYIIYIHTHT